MVIRFTFYNSTRSIESLGEDESHHLMGERHLGKRDFLVGTVIDRLRETVWSADDKDEAAGGGLLALQPLGVLDAPKLLSMFIEQHHGVGWLNLFQYQFTLTFLLLLFAEALGVLQLGDGGDGERHIVSDALGIVLDASDEMLVDGLADQNEFCLHELYLYL